MKEEIQIVSKEMSNQQTSHEFILALEKFLTGLNKQPQKKDIKKRTVEYLPISNIETNLDRLFCGLWETVNMNWQVVVNEIVVSIELRVFHPVAKIWITRSGVGAAMIRQNRGAKISDIDAKIKNALEMDVAHAKADAIKNAAKSLGNMFGRNLSRKKEEVTNYQGILLSNAAKIAKK